MSYDDSLAFINMNTTRVVFGSGSLPGRQGRAAGARLQPGAAGDRLGPGARHRHPGAGREGPRRRLRRGLLRGRAGLGGPHRRPRRRGRRASVGADAIVSVGGGSAIDTAKGIAIVLKEGGQLRDYQGFQVLSRRQTPHVAIPTTAGTGSEVTYVAVIKDHEAHQKLLFGDYNIIPERRPARPRPHRRPAAAPDRRHGHGRHVPRGRVAPLDADAADRGRPGAARHPPRSRVPAARGRRRHGPGGAGADADRLEHGRRGLLQRPGRAGPRHRPHRRRPLRGPPRHRQLDPDAARRALQRESRSRPPTGPWPRLSGSTSAGLDDAACAEAAATRLLDLAARVGLPLRLRDEGVPEDALPDARRGHPRRTPRSSTTAGPVLGAEDVLEVLRAAW